MEWRAVDGHDQLDGQCSKRARGSVKELIEFLAGYLVDRPEEVEVHEIAGETTNVYELRTGDGDLGKIIGKHGRTIHAIRIILSAVATKENKRATLELLE